MGIPIILSEEKHYHNTLRSMTSESFYVLFILICFLPIFAMGQSASLETPAITIKKTGDFDITGDGAAGNWNETEWISLAQRTNRENVQNYTTKAKVLYSNTGLYVLFHSKDNRVTTPFTKNYEELWLGDVVEVFLWTNKSEPNYFEYEISPLDYELPLIVSNLDGELLHWLPFENSYNSGSGRKVRHKTTVINGKKENGAAIEGWTAEIFIPFKLLHPLENIYPASGTTWRANLYRIDYDGGETLWSWSPFRENFHDYHHFGTFRFE